MIIIYTRKYKGKKQRHAACVEGLQSPNGESRWAVAYFVVAQTTDGGGCHLSKTGHAFSPSSTFRCWEAVRGRLQDLRPNGGSGAAVEWLVPALNFALLQFPLLVRLVSYGFPIPTRI
jgi:hypothetical protein